MGEGKVQKDPKLGRHLPVVADFNGRRGDPARGRIAGIHARRATEGISRKLIQQQHQRQCAVRRRQPAIEIAARGTIC